MTSKSPFGRASRRDLVALREMATAVSAWKREAAAGRFRMLDSFWSILSGRAGIDDAIRFVEFENRALSQLSRLPEWPVIEEQRRLAFLQAYEPQVYEVTQLRAEVAALRDQLTALAPVTA